MPSSFVIPKSHLFTECAEFAPQQFDLMRQTAHMFTLNRIQDQLKTEMSVIRPIPKLNHSQPTYLEPFQKLQMSHYTDDMFQSHALAAAAAAAAAAGATVNPSKIPTAIPVSRESAFTPIPQKNHVVNPNNAAAAAAAAAAASFCFNNCQTCVPRTGVGLNEIHRLPHYLDSLLMQSCEPFLGGHRNGLLAAAAAAAAAVDPSASCFSYGLTEQCFTISPHLSHHSPKLSAHLKDEDNKLSLANSLISAQFQHRYQPSSLTISKNPSSLALAGLAGQASRSWTENNIISFLNLPPPLINNTGSGVTSGISVNRNGTGENTAANQAAAAALLAKEFRQTTNHPPRYQCEACKKSYATFGGLSKHKQFHCITQVKREFSCKFCSKSYASLGALKMHIRTHTLPCRCKLCGKAFSRPWLLQGHIRTHTGEKPFKCPHCGRAFADRSNLRAHLQTHSDVKKYGCKTCNKTFSRMSLLLKHEDSSCPGIRC